MITFGCLDYCDCGDCDDYGDGDGEIEEEFRPGGSVDHGEDDRQDQDQDLGQNTPHYAGCQVASGEKKIIVGCFCFRQFIVLKAVFKAAVLFTFKA